MNKTRITIIIVTVSIFCWGQITNSGQTPSVREGHDFTTVPADADYKAGELLVRFAPKADGQQRSLTEKRQILTSLGGATIKYNFKLAGLTLVKLPAGMTVIDALKTFNGKNGILYAEPNYKIRFGSTFPNDPCFPKLWGMHNTGQAGGTPDADIDAPEAWDIATDSNIIVAVLDSGVDYNHPDLKDNIWINPGEDHEPFGVVGPEDFDGVDDDNNTYVDDIRGWDFDIDDGNDNDPMDDNGHGTMCAGIIGAVGDNNEGLTGVCWNVKIMGLNISHSGETYWEIFVSQAIKGIQYAIDKQAKVLNASWGDDVNSQSLKDEIYNAGQAGALFVTIAHNYNRDIDEEGKEIYPACYGLDNIITVMATDENDERSIWTLESSNWGPNSVDLAAPGSNIWRCVLGGGYDEYGAGTSAAAPHVAGACALVWAANPQLSHLEVKNIILNTVDELEALENDPSYGRLCLTGGRLNLYNAMTYKPPLFTLNKVDVNEPNSVLPGDYITYTITYGPNGVDHNNVVLADYLPGEVDFNSASGPNSVYEPNTHTVTWNIGHLNADDPCNPVTLTVKVNEGAEPNGVITNYCEIESDSAFSYATADTDVGPWQPDSNIIYVDSLSPCAPGTGMSWRFAYRDLQDALERAAHYGSEIWVAKGTYKPTTNQYDSSATFELVDGVGLYGGFAGNEISRSWRNWMGNETTLTGDLNGNGVWESTDAYYVVTASGVTETAIIDGFTIKNGLYSGIMIIGGSPTISHNRITENGEEGIYCKDMQTPLITNNWIHHNGAFGIFFNIAYGVATVRNNTVVYNTNSGIRRRFGDAPNITNCIIWGNTDDLYECYATYSCIENDDPGEGNIYDDPCFVDDPNNPNNYHLSSDSPCIDAGDPCFVPDDPNEKDIDGQRRVSDGDANGTYIVDMGADEYNRIPQDPHKFYIKNNSDETVAWFGNLGNLVLKGTFTSGEMCIPPADSNSFIIRNSTDETVAYIDNEGNLCIEGDWGESCANCNPTTDAFIIRDSSDANVSYIDFEYGDLCLTGRLYPNSNP